MFGLPTSCTLECAQSYVPWYSRCALDACKNETLAMSMADMPANSKFKQKLDALYKVCLPVDPNPRPKVPTPSPTQSPTCAWRGRAGCNTCMSAPGADATLASCLSFGLDCGCTSGLSLGHAD